MVCRLPDPNTNKPVAMGLPMDSDSGVDPADDELLKWKRRTLWICPPPRLAPDRVLMERY